MEFIENLPDPLRYAVMAIFVCWGFVLWKNWRKAKTQFNEVEYIPEQILEEAAWGWAQPPSEIGLAVEQTEENSVLVLGPVRSMNENFFGVMGFALAALTVVLGVLSIVRQINEASYTPFLLSIGVGITLLFAYGLCCADAPITQIIRRQDRLELKIRLGIFFHRTATYKSSQAHKCKFTGKIQGFLAMNTDQLDRLPDFYLTIHRRFRTSRRFLMRCNPSQGNWIIAGLAQWREVVSK